MSVRSLQRSEGDVSDFKYYIYYWSWFLRKLVFQFLKLSGWNFLKSLISIVRSIQVGTIWIGQLYHIAPIGMIKKLLFKNLKKL